MRRKDIVDCVEHYLLYFIGWVVALLENVCGEVWRHIANLGSPSIPINYTDYCFFLFVRSSGSIDLCVLGHIIDFKVFFYQKIGETVRLKYKNFASRTYNFAHHQSLEARLASKVEYNVSFLDQMTNENNVTWLPSSFTLYSIWNSEIHRVNIHIKTIVRRDKLFPLFYLCLMCLHCNLGLSSWIPAIEWNVVLVIVC